MFWQALLFPLIAATFTGDDHSLRAHCIDVLHDETPCTRGCKPGYHGSFCKDTCSEHCGGACSQDTGHCLTGCKPNWFTSNCSQSCSGNCVDDVCDRRSGECIRGCRDGFYGLNCNETCSGNCTEGKCDVYGGCHCKKGVLDKFCYIDCTDNCIGGACAVDHDGQLKCLQGCKEGRMGPFCNEWCPYECSTSCNSSCVPKVMKRRVKRDIQNNCREESNCQDRFRGLECNISCPACRYDRNCSLYCAAGSWGEECHLPCPQDCSRASNKRSFCKHKSGLCQDCLQGYFGYLCELKCSSTCKQNYCFINNGSCSSGCNPGYWGRHCTNRCGNCLEMKCEQNGSCICIDNYYGPRCEDKCSEGCDGNCSIIHDGNHICNGECKVGYSGVDCKGGCPEGCRSSFCRRKDGTCADSEISTQSSNLVSIFVAIIIPIVALTTIILIVILWRKKMLCWKPQSSTPSEQLLEVTEDRPPDVPDRITESTPMISVSGADSLAGEHTGTPRRESGQPHDHETTEDNPMQNTNITEDPPPDVPDAGIPMESTPMPGVSTAGLLVTEESTSGSEGGPPQDHEAFEHNTVQNTNSTVDHQRDIPDRGTTTESTPTLDKSTADSLIRRGTIAESTSRSEDEPSHDDETKDANLVQSTNSTEGHLTDIPDRGTTESIPMHVVSTAGSFVAEETAAESTPRGEERQPQHRETVEHDPVQNTNDAGPPESHQSYTPGTEENEYKDLH